MIKIIKQTNSSEVFSSKVEDLIYIESFDQFESVSKLNLKCIISRIDSFKLSEIKSLVKMVLKYDIYLIAIYQHWNPSVEFISNYANLEVIKINDKDFEKIHSLISKSKLYSAIDLVSIWERSKLEAFFLKSVSSFNKEVQQKMLNYIENQEKVEQLVIALWSFMNLNDR